MDGSREVSSPKWKSIRRLAAILMTRLYYTGLRMLLLNCARLLLSSMTRTRLTAVMEGHEDCRARKPNEFELKHAM